MNRTIFGDFREKVGRYGNLLIAASLAFSGFMPIILASRAGAGQLIVRKVTISSSQPDLAGINYLFSFNTVTSAPVQSMIFEFCNTALSTCVLPGTDASPTASERIDIAHQTAAPGAFTGTNSTAFTEQTIDAGACTDADTGSGTATMYCVTRTQAAAEATGTKTFEIQNITNPIIAQNPGPDNNEEVYIRITLFSDTAFATKVDEGTVAASIVNQLLATGRVQERLKFCVYALDDAVGSSATVGSASTELPTDCTASEANASTTVDIGVVDNLTLATSPVDNNAPTSLGNDRFGALQINTNASNGVTLTYYATAAATGTNELRAFRVSGASCNASGTSLTDQCFISADDATGEAFTAGTERFGIQIACVVNNTVISGIGTTSNLGKNSSGVYTSGDGTGGSFNSVYDADTSGPRTSLDDDNTNRNCENDPGGTFVDEKFAWRDSSTAQALLSSTTVIDDELVKIRYGATASATTPTGTYTAASTFIAVATF